MGFFIPQRPDFGNFFDQQLLNTNRKMRYAAASCRSIVATVKSQITLAQESEKVAMKTLTMAAVMLALIAVPASAQMGGKRHKGDDNNSAQKKPQVDDKAYKAALQRIPEPKEKYDPWSVARPSEPDKKTK